MSIQKDWYVYLLQCRDDSLYTGISNDVEKRMTTHKSGKGSKYVTKKGFKQLLYTVKCVDKVDAAKLEYRIKQLPRDEKITFFVNHPDLDYSILHT